MKTTDNKTMYFTPVIEAMLLQVYDKTLCGSFTIPNAEEVEGDFNWQ